VDSREGRYLVSCQVSPASIPDRDQSVTRSSPRGAWRGIESSDTAILLADSSVRESTEAIRSDAALAYERCAQYV